jgi:hypothetical protein
MIRRLPGIRAIYDSISQMPLLVRTEGAAGVQGLEDFLGVLVNAQVNDDHLQSLSDHRVQRQRPCLNVLQTLRAEPQPCLLTEIAMRLDHASPSRLERSDAADRR